MKWLNFKKNDLPKPSLEQQRAEKLAEMGSKLSAARQQLGLSLDEMVAHTRIPRRLLQAIEEGNLEDLPEPIYIQGLIRQFADAVGFKGAEFASNFPVGYQIVNLPSVGKTKSIHQLRPIHLYLVYIVLIVCAVNSLSQLLNKTAITANNSNIQPSVEPDRLVTRQSTPVKQLTRTIPVSDRLTDNKDNQSVQIGVTLTAASWIRVVADGKTEFEGILPQGARRVWKAQEQLTIKTNNAGGVLMSVNQQAAKQMGEVGKAEEIKIAAAKPE
ncbi:MULTISPECIES: RodZ family helix-turn-helix domain-containing protein [unclassified Anabaena]|uniref:helix-turn-helix domain-containing protein n=1 Tax=unclassified Anabaena TaxID=2619674 RepID=UPI0008304CF7|nr:MULTISPECIES: RodZ family helix-turn-helix domain-containing protein [unclassified Anabaena]